MILGVVNQRKGRKGELGEKMTGVKQKDWKTKTKMLKNYLYSKN